VLEVARGAAAAARSLAKGGGQTNQVSAFASVATESAALVSGAATGRAEPRVKAFLEELDGEIVRCELVAMLAARKLAPTAPVARVCFRPAGSGKLPALVLARLENERYGAWVKLKARWDWIEGERADVLASIPEAYFDAAVRATVGEPQS
jgi:hypothetical protein